MAEQKSKSTISKTSSNNHAPTSAAPNGSIPISARCKFGQLRAPKRCIIESKRGSHRPRRNQRNDSGKLSEKTAVERNQCSVSISEKIAGIPVPQSMSLDASPPQSPGCEASSPSGQTLPEKKRPRPEMSEHDDSLDLSVSAPASCMRDESHLVTFGETRAQSATRAKVFACEESLVNMERLRDLLAREPHYHPNNAFLFYVNPDVDDKVDAALRNEAVHNLRFMHNAFFNLSTETFCKAINLIDRFIVKVKVKPKYMACVATASYCAASKLTHPKTEDFDLPAPDTLVHITRCGGNGADLIRMEEILASKLSNDLDGVNAYDFLRTFTDALVVQSARTAKTETEDSNINAENLDSSTDTVRSALSSSSGDRNLPQPPRIPVPSSDTPDPDSDSSRDPQHLTATGNSTPTSPNMKVQYNQLLKRVATRLEIALCSLEIYRFRPACLALGILAQTGVVDLLPLAHTCGVEWTEVCECARLVDELYEVYYRDPLPSSRRQLVWNLSRRTLFRIGYSSPTPLDTISEDYEPADEDDWLLPLLFEP